MPHGPRTGSVVIRKLNKGQVRFCVGWKWKWQAEIPNFKWKREELAILKERKTS